MYWWGPLVLLFAFVLMEISAWATHKYLMHGIMWLFHRDHHVKGEENFLEKNDIFFLIFAIPSWLGIMLGMIYNQYFFVWMGYGIAVYGLAYFLVHDVFIHRRFKWIKNIDTPYFHAIRKAHKVHHKKQDKEHGECFGMLWVPRKYYIEAKNAIKAKTNAV
jgi:beta-carotene 3-hydroxylase